MALLEIKNLNLCFKLETGIYNALNNISLTLQEGKMHSIVGESGCGKTMTAMSIIKLLPKNAVISDGQIIFKGTNLLKQEETELRKLRGKNIALIPQDPMTSLNPLYTIGNQLAEIINKDKNLSKEEFKQKAIEVLSAVKISNAEEKLSMYPHELSGGMKQRIIIAMALASNAELIIADEPTTALDVTIQAQIMKLLIDIKNERNTTILLITHDLGVVGEYSDEISVMYAGNIVENCQTAEFFKNTTHPYSKALLKALPSQNSERTLKTIPGQPPNIQEKINGCKFSPRCEFFEKGMCENIPNLENIGNNHFVACFKK